jgi:hypothetical protein
MEVVGQVTMDRALYGRIVRAGLRKQVLRFRVLGALLLVAGALMVAFSSTWWLGLMELVAGLYCVLIPWLMVVLGARKMGVGDGQVWSYRASPDGAGQSSPVADVSVVWPNVLGVEERAVGWVLRLRAGGFLVLPQQAFDPDRWPRVGELVRTRGPALRR